MTGTLDRDEFIAGFLAEADEHLQSSIARLLAVDAALKTGEPHHRMVRELFRSLHTLKGLSAMVGAEPVVEIAHVMESVLRRKDRTGGRLTPHLVELLLNGVRAIEQRVAAFGQKKPVPPAPRQLLEAFAALEGVDDAPAAGSSASLDLAGDLLAKLSNAEEDELLAGVSRGRKAFRIDFAPSPARAAAGHTITSVRERVAAVADLVKVLPRAGGGVAPGGGDVVGGLVFSIIVVTDLDAAILAERTGVEVAGIIPIHALAAPVEPVAEDEVDTELRAPSGDFIRVDVKRLDDSLEKLSSLVVTRFRLGRAISDLRERGVEVRELSSIVSDVGRQLAALRDSITRVRMVSVAELLERVPLIVRGMSKTTGKSVRLVIDAGKAELDKAVGERIFPAIVHLVRNAVDHAIEPPEERRRLGKSEEGTITVACFELSDSQLELSITDDGRGIDAKNVAARAGVSVPEDDAGLLALITRPGLSTAAVATTTSGRGMGMDIVKKIAVDQLGGELALRTTPGLGATFTLHIPLSVSILDSFSFLCGGQVFVVPVAAVEEIVEVAAVDVFTAPSAHRADQGYASTRLLKRRGQVVPLFELAQLLALEAVAGRKALVIRRHGTAYAFAVERMISKQEVVVRPVDDPLVKLPGIAGTTDLGDGRPTLVLDLMGLAAAASIGPRPSADSQAPSRASQLPQSSTIGPAVAPAVASEVV